MNEKDNGLSNYPVPDSNNRELNTADLAEALLLIKDKDTKLCFLKCERLISAIYLVTSGMPDQEPIKKTLRESSLSLLSLFKIFFENVNSVLDESDIKKVIAVELLEMHSLVSIASMSGLLKEGTASLISVEISIIAGIITTSGSRRGGVMLPESFFQIDESALENKNESYNIGSKSEEIKNKPSSISHKNPKSGKTLIKKTFSQGSSKGQKAEERQSTILGFLKDNGESTIKDILKKISGFSKKTLQRDLNTMSSEGIIEKRGDKRWSTYVLKK